MTPERKLEVAKFIQGAEARRDAKGRIKVYALPKGDGGGRFEYSGLNERFNGPVLTEILGLVRAGQHERAERVALEAIAADTEPVVKWGAPDAVEAYLRDTWFNRGPLGAAMTLQYALDHMAIATGSARVAVDGKVGRQTRAALDRADARELLVALRWAREYYEINEVGRRPKFWAGLVNRWDNAYQMAQAYL